MQHHGDHNGREESEPITTTGDRDGEGSSSEGQSMEHHEMDHGQHEMPKKGKENHKGKDHSGMLGDIRKRFLFSLILTAPVLLLSPTIQSLLGFQLAFPYPHYVSFILASIIFLYGGYPFLLGFASEIRDRKLGMMTLIALAISIAYFYSTAVVFGLSGEVFFWELATLIDIMLLGHWVEMRSVMGASRALEELVRIMPSEAHLFIGGNVTDVGIETLKVGDVVLVKPGEKVPVDGIIKEGESTNDESFLTGESVPVTKSKGGTAIGGAINGAGVLYIEVKKTGDETYLSQVINLVKEAQESKSRTQDLANRAAFYLTVIAILVGSATLAAWLVYGSGLEFAIERAVTVMVISCPHALGLAVPLVVAVSTSIAARSGLLIRDRTAFERAKDLKAIVFDKTGTLTEGKFGLTDVVKLGDTDEMRLVQIAASLESNSEHPIARGILNGAKDRGLKLLAVERFKALPGKGIEGMINGRLYRAVSPGYLREKSIAVANNYIDRIALQGKTMIYVLEGESLLGALALADIIRKESKEAIDTLKTMGIKCMMLTGDNRYVAEWVAKELGLDEHFSEVLPHQKSEVIRGIREKYVTAMVGDGVNDAPALVQSDVGIAIGAGTDVAIESADIILVRNDPRDVVAILGLSRRTYSKMLQNLLWATGYNSFAIPIAAGVLISFGILLTPAFGAVLMSASTIIVAINARLLRL